LALALKKTSRGVRYARDFPKSSELVGNLLGHGDRNRAKMGVFNSSQLITRNPHRSAHGLLLVNTTAQNSVIHRPASRQADERGK
jgi:hypothetical protein